MMPTNIELRPILLFLHFLAIAGAVATSGIMHFALVKLRRAQRTPQALDALQVLKVRGPRMPLWGVALFLTGAAVTQTSGLWRQPFVGAGTLGIVVMLGVSAALLKPRMPRLARRVATAGDVPIAGDLAAAVRDPVLWSGALVNSAIAYGVMFDMVVKPTMAGCLTVLAVAALGAIGVAMLSRPAAVAREEAAEATR